MTTQMTAQCSPGVHTFYASDLDARAIAHAKSRDGLFFLAEKCSACSGWRLQAGLVSRRPYTAAG